MSDCLTDLLIVIDNVLLAALPQAPLPHHHPAAVQYSLVPRLFQEKISFELFSDDPV